MADLEVADRILDADPRTLKQALASRKEAVVDAWLDRAVRAYPPETAALLKREGDRFGNPVGHSLSVGLRAVVDGLLSDADMDELAACLEPVLKIRSVQSLPAFQALAFVFMLKDVIVEALGQALRAPGIVAEWFELEGRIDQLALRCFDSYMRLRERAHDIHVRAIKRQVSGYLRRFELADPWGAAPAGDGQATAEEPDRGSSR